MRRVPWASNALKCASSAGAVVVSIRPAGTTATTPPRRASAICIRTPPHREVISIVAPFVPGVIHQLPHERDAQPSGLALVERAAGVGRRNEQRIERLGLVDDLDG